jgi:hypothetical protein
MSLVKLSRISRYAGWLAYVSAILVVLAAVLLVHMYYYALTPGAYAPGGASPDDFSHLLDILGLCVSALALPLPVALYQLSARHGWRLSWVAMAFGVLGWLTISVTQALLIITRINFEVTEPFAMAGLALLGGWMIVANHLARAESALERWRTWLGELIGMSFVLALVAIVLSSLSPALIGVVFVLALPGALAFIVGFPLWLIGVGRQLLTAPMESVVSNQCTATLEAS